MGVRNFYKRSRKMRQTIDKLAAEVSDHRPISHKSAIAPGYARTLSDMFAAGVPLVEALGIRRGATGTSCLKTQ